MSKKEKIASRYDKWTHFYDFLDDFPLISRPQKRWRKKAVDALGLKGDELVLDIGTATGKMLPIIADQLKEGRVVGTDISEKMIMKAKEFLHTKGLEEVKVVYDDILESRFPDGYFDRIIATFTFTTISSPEKAVKECYRILRDGGKMIVLDTGKPNNSLAYPIFIPMMLSAKLFGRTNIDVDVIKALKKEFKVKRISTNLFGMVYTIKCVKN